MDRITGGVGLARRRLSRGVSAAGDDLSLLRRPRFVCYGLLVLLTAIAYFPRSCHVAALGISSRIRPSPSSNRPIDDQYNSEAFPGSYSAGMAWVTREALWFNQTLDHFSPLETATFPQRYYQYLRHFRAPDGPIFLLICGEAACGGIKDDYVVALAEHFGAAVVCLEHRYYGQSFPFTELTRENLKYLTIEQALSDLASFRTYYQKLLNRRIGKHVDTGDNRWFTFGISYAGAMSAWFRLKYPHLTRGSLASSGVVLAILNYTTFDAQVAKSAGPECSDALRAATSGVEKALLRDAVGIKTKFGAAQLENHGDFLYMLADAAAFAFQYGQPRALCDPMVQALENGSDTVDAYALYVNGVFQRLFNVDPLSYGQDYLKNVSIFSQFSGVRLWWWQVCTEVAYWQVAPKFNSIRSELVNYEYHQQLCENLFGKGALPDVDATNQRYGGTKIAGSRIFFSNGSQDPWRHASKQTSTPAFEEPAYIVTCSNCGHGSDLRGCPQWPSQNHGDPSQCTNPQEVINVRAVIKDTMELWLSDEKVGHGPMIISDGNISMRK